MSENEQMDSDTSFSFVLKGKKISFSDESTPGKHDSQKENCSADQQDLSTSSGIHFQGVNDTGDELSFLAYKLPPSKPSENSSRPSNFGDALTPILRNTPIINSSTNEDADESMELSFRIKCPAILRLKSPESPTQSPEPFYLSSSRLGVLEKRSNRSTSTPCNASKKVVKSLLNSLNSFEDADEPSRRNLFPDNNSVMDVDEGDEEEEKETSSTGLSWKEGMSNLIGDMSAPYRLPLHSSKHQDLKAISPDTMADLLKGKYDKILEKFLVVDCRYPYEFEGGHIVGAMNIFEQETLLEKFFTSPPQDVDDHLVIVFHCEFSSERAPKMLRFMRNYDRDSNQDSYPSLFYPELYLLEGGYSAFFPLHPTLCDPSNYLPMLHPDHVDELRSMQSKRRGVQDEMAKNKLKIIKNFCNSIDS